MDNGPPDDPLTNHMSQGVKTGVGHNQPRLSCPSSLDYEDRDDWEPSQTVFVLFAAVFHFTVYCWCSSSSFDTCDCCRDLCRRSVPWIFAFSGWCLSVSITIRLSLLSTKSTKSSWEAFTKKLWVSASPSTVKWARDGTNPCDHIYSYNNPSIQSVGPWWWERTFLPVCFVLQKNRSICLDMRKSGGAVTPQRSASFTFW